MRDFFHGWRRKIGCVTLVMALALMVFWMRSRVMYDFVGLNLSQATYRFCTLGSCARFVKQTPPDGGQLFDWRTGELTDIAGYGLDENGEPEVLDEWEGEVEWRCDVLDFHAGAGHYSSKRVAVWVLPYWSFVLPLTFLSGYLIFSKPRKKTNVVPDSKSGERVDACDCAN